MERGKALFFSNEVGCAACHPPPTFAEDERLHIVPTLDADLRALLVRAAGETQGQQNKKK